MYETIPKRSGRKMRLHQNAIFCFGPMDSLSTVQSWLPRYSKGYNALRSQFATLEMRDICATDLTYNPLLIGEDAMALISKSCNA